MTSLATSAPPPSTLVPSFFPSVVVARRKDSAPHHKPIGSLPRYPYWHPNSHDTLWVLAVDLDHDDSLLRVLDAVRAGLPAPSYVLERGSNGHAQAGWFIERVATGPNARMKPMQYAHDVRAALTHATGADPQFINGRCWNPWGWGDEGPVIWGPTAPRSLGQLREALAAAGLWTPTRRGTALRGAPSTRGRIADPDESQRNYVFDMARLRVLSPDLREAAEFANADLLVRGYRGLRPREIESTVASIAGWEDRTGRRGGTAMNAEERAAQAARGRKGGSAGTAAQAAQRAQALPAGPAAAAAKRSAKAARRAQDARILRDAGRSPDEIAEAMQLSRRTVFRLLSAP